MRDFPFSWIEIRAHQMALSDDLTDYVKTTFRTRWGMRKGQIVPDPEDLKLSNDAVEFERATVLYADLSGSTSMVDSRTWQFAAEIYKAFLCCAARVITDGGGEIAAYDGDRIMGVFIDGSQSTRAAKCGLKINRATKNIIMPALKDQYSDTDFTLRHVVGIDTSPLRAARTGVRGDNDLVWVGRAANHAAKLTELDADYATWITGTLFDMLADDAKYADNPSKTLMWEKRLWTPMGNMEIYRSNWTWKV
jgi:class 3 adenylate cyclase